MQRKESSAEGGTQEKKSRKSHEAQNVLKPVPFLSPSCLQSSKKSQKKKILIADKKLHNFRGVFNFKYHYINPFILWMGKVEAQRH